MSGTRTAASVAPVRSYAVVVAVNYAAQIVYALHLYGLGFGRSGALLLGATFVWFLVAIWLFQAGRPVGYWLLLAYATVQFLFYFATQVVAAFWGYGLGYHLTQTQDPIVWLTFVIGDVNFVAAGIVIVYLLKGRHALTDDHA